LVPWPNSVGLFYAQFTASLGFERFQDEWKVMGLAPYGGPGIDLEKYIEVSNGLYSVNSRLLIERTNDCDVAGLERELGPWRKPDEPLSDRHRAVAWAVQDACEWAEARKTRIGLGARCR
jgi:carbamoyltransferase